MKSLLVKLGVILVAISLFCPYNSFAERDSIWFEGMEIKIGMPKNTVLFEIAKNYKITKSDSSDKFSDMWLITPRDGGDMVGTIEFIHAKVHKVTKFLGSFGDHQGYKFAINFFNLLSKLQAEGRKVTYFNTLSVEGPKTSSHPISFYFEGKQVDVFIWEDEKHGGRGMSINESLTK